MTEDNRKILNAIPLVEVMRANGYEPWRLPSRSGGRVKYRCPLPGHSDCDPSFMVDQTVQNGADALGWGCFGCNRRGYGAISLQAALMGYDHTALTGEQMREVMQRLADDHDVEADGFVPMKAEQRTTAIAPQECEFDPTTWTAEHLRALGFTVKLATEQGEDGELVVRYKQESDWHDATSDELQPLYRCSIDREYWRGRGEVRTAQEWGEILEREFNIYPVETFITAPTDAPNGGKISLKIHARQTYPIFALVYEWGVKKYEPKNKGKNKWYWSAKGISNKVYGDRLAMLALKNVIPTADATEGTADTPWYADVKKDRRHPLVELTKTEKGEKGTYCKMKRLVLCSGPRDAMQMWAATDAHVVWLHNELAGLHDGVVDEWLQALLYRMTQVAVDVYVCYDIDETGVASSGSIVLENAQVHWMRLPREMMKIENSKLSYRKCKDVTDFVTYFHQIQKLLSPDLRKTNPSEALMRMLKNALTMQFWIDKPTTKKDKDGERETNVRYVLSVANLLQFLEAKGIRSAFA